MIHNESPRKRHIFYLHALERNRLFYEKYGFKRIKEEECCGYVLNMEDIDERDILMRLMLL